MSADDARFEARREDWHRHVVDLQTRTYEGASTRSAREAILEEAFRLTTPVAVRVLESLSAAYLGGAGDITVTPPARVAPEELEGATRTPTGGTLGSWSLTWPALERARSRLTGEPLPPVEVFAMFPDDFTHAHLALFSLHRPRTWIACWPFQVTTAEDAERQADTLAVIAEADMHDRTFAGDLNWRLLEV
jgi:hypothetical protein